MKKKTRLQALAAMVKGPCVLADIGCDHALLPISLIKQGICTHAYACDINEGPLSRAKEAIQQANLSNRITPILSDGLSKIQDDVTCIVIAGMGYDTIVHILENDIERLNNVQQIVVQCNGHEEYMRKWISEHGFMIDAECIVKERHYYQLISFHKEPCEQLDEEACMFGLMLENDPLFEEYWTMRYKKKKAILKQLPNHHENYIETENILHMIQKKLAN